MKLAIPPFSDLDNFPAPGLYAGLSAETYHGDREAVGNSTLGLLLRSPRHFKHHQEHGQATDTPALAAGRRLHSCVEWLLTGCDPANEVAVFEGRRAGKAWQAFKEEAEAAGKAVWSATEYDAATALAFAIVGNPVVAASATDALIEVTAVADIDGHWIKARADMIATSGPHAGAIIDFKTTTDASPEGFLRSVDRYQYDRQAALYLEVFQRAGVNVDHFILVAVEKEPPYLAQAYELDEGILFAGRRQYRHALSLLKRCIEQNAWPGYCTDDLHHLEAPSWGRFAPEVITLNGQEVAL